MLRQSVSLDGYNGGKRQICHARCVMMEGYGLAELKKNVREIEPIALATSFKILID